MTKYAIPGISPQFASHSFHSAAGHNLFTVGGPLHRSQRTCNGRQKSHPRRGSSVPPHHEIYHACVGLTNRMQWHNKVDGFPRDVWDLWHWRKEGIPPGRLYEWTRHRKQRREEEGSSKKAASIECVQRQRGGCFRERGGYGLVLGRFLNVRVMTHVTSL